MIEPWFDPMYAWLPGTLLGVLGGVFGAVIGTVAPTGKAKGLVMGLFWALFGACAVMLGLGVAGYAQGQPYGVWYGLGLAGFIGVTVLGCNYFGLVAAYRRAEQRRIEAEDLG
jgi:hypothetical protein